jgi:hypothetical protein
VRVIGSYLKLYLLATLFAISSCRISVCAFFNQSALVNINGVSKPLNSPVVIAFKSILFVTQSFITCGILKPVAPFGINLLAILSLTFTSLIYPFFNRFLKYSTSKFL